MLSSICVIAGWYARPVVVDGTAVVVKIVRHVPLNASTPQPVGLTVGRFAAASNSTVPVPSCELVVPIDVAPVSVARRWPVTNGNDQPVKSALAVTIGAVGVGCTFANEPTTSAVVGVAPTVATIGFERDVSVVLVTGGSELMPRSSSVCSATFEPATLPL